MRHNHLKASTSLLRAVAMAFVVVLAGCGGGGDAACNAGLGALLSSASNCGPAPNDAPVAKTGPIQNVKLDDLVTLDGSTSTDPNKDLLTYKWEFVSKPTDSLATLLLETTAKPTFTADKVGIYSIKLVVSDGKASSVAALSTVVASLTNSAPVAKPGIAQSVTVNADVVLDGSLSSDADGNSLTYKWTLLSKPDQSTAALKFSTAALSSFKADKAGIYVASLVVNDGRVDSEPAAVTVQAFAANVPPVAVAGIAQSVMFGKEVKLDGRGSSDANSDPITFTWSLVSVPDGSGSVTVFNAIKNSQTPTFTPDRAGSYVFSLVVNDGKVDSNVSATVVTVARENVAPVANAGEAQVASVGATVKLDGALSLDANYDPITYKWALVSAPAGNTVELDKPTNVRPTFIPLLAGTYVFSLKVNDSKLDSDPAIVVITVSPSGLSGGA